jgi:hypothetical protein
MIGLNYYYKGNFKNAKTYEERSMRGHFESENSHCKVIMLRELNRKKRENEI